MSEEIKQKPKVAVALSYNPELDQAPVVVAKGAGMIAENIMDKARQHGVPVYPQPIMAEVLVKQEIGSSIPPDMYQMMAQVLAFVYQLDGRAKKYKQG